MINQLTILVVFYRLRQKNRVIVYTEKTMSFVTNTYALCNKGIGFDITLSFVTICVN